MIYKFDTNMSPQLNEVGGKAKALIDMTKAGLRVPEGIALSVEFFANWNKSIRESDVWKQAIEEPTKESCDRLVGLAQRLVLSEQQREELNRYIMQISSPNNLYAVRSSSPEEDLEGTSFAGMYETILGVKKEVIEVAIKKAYASMLDFRVMEYKRLNNINIENTKISVIVQRQVNSEVSGIGFSLNPFNNCYDEAVINASFGLGEAIVSGIVTPDKYVVDKVKMQIIDKSINDKKNGIFLQVNGGTEDKILDDASKEALSDKQILEVARMIMDCEKYYSIPIDTEWAYEGEVLYLLQARPITTYIPLFDELVTKPGEQKNLYLDMMGLSQGFTEPFSVLGLDIWGKLLDMTKGDIMPVGFDGGIIPIHGRQYLHVSNIAKGIGMKTIIKLFGTYDTPTKLAFESVDFKNDYLPAKKTDKMKTVIPGMFKLGIKLGPTAVKSLVVDHKKMVKEYVELSEQIRKNIMNYQPDNKFFDMVVDEVLEGFETITSSFGVVISGMTSFSKLKKLFKDKESEVLLLTLGMDLKGNPTSDMGHSMFKLANYEDMKTTKNGEEFIRRIKDRKYSEEFLKDYDRYMDRYGCRGFKEIDIESSRAYDDLDKFFMQLKSINLDSNQLLDVTKRRDTAYNKLLELAKEKGVEKKFIKHAEIYQTSFGFREDPKYLYVVCVGRLRGIALDVGEEFVRQGRLKVREQIFDLHLEQIVKAQKDRRYDLMADIKHNKEPYKLVEHIKNWPTIIDSRGKIFTATRKSEEGDIVGDPISPGKIVGKAKVLNSPYEKSLDPGEILVTKATEPAWTPIFVNAAGVVLEVGGILQHGAIIAREYGIPCVSGISGVQDLIKDGDLLEVDGTSGIVKILEES